MNWKIGQKLVCIGNASSSRYPECCPKQNEIVTYDGLSDLGNIYLEEYKIPNPYERENRIAYFAELFRPLLGQSATDELVSSFAEVTETSDLPIKQPERFRAWRRRGF